jgi:hypothetical protein
MSVPVSSIFGTHSNRIQEILNKNLEYQLPMLDPFWQDNVVTSQGVGKVDDLGRDLKVIKLYQGSLTGEVEGMGARNDFGLYGDALNQNLGAKLFTQGNGFSPNAQVFPNGLNGANARTYRLGIPMRGMTAGLALTMGEMSAEALPATIGNIVGDKMKAWARNMAMYFCNNFYLSQNNYYKICAVSSASAVSVASVTVLRFSPDNYAVDRFAVGQLVQVYDSTGTTKRSTPSGADRFFVTRVDELENTVDLAAVDGLTVGTVGTHISNTDIIVYNNSKGTASTPFSAGQRFTGFAGINSYLKYGHPSVLDGSTEAAINANFILGTERDTSNTINVQEHTEFKSMNRDLAGEPLTESFLRKVFRRWVAAKRKYGQEIDCLVASDGVWLAYENTRVGRETVDRTGRLSSGIKNQGSQTDNKFGGFEFTMDGKTYTGYTSTFVESGTVYGHKKGGGNWKRYVPPSPKNTKRVDGVPFAPVEFVAPALTGGSSPFHPIYKVENGQNRLTEFVSLPAMCRMQLVPDQIPGLRLINCGEERIYSTASAV